MNLYVGRLPRTINETKLRELFEQYGPVTSIKLIKDKFTGALKGFAFIEMPENDQANEAIVGNAYDTMASINQQTADNNKATAQDAAIVSLTKDNATMQAQKENATAATNLGTNMDSTANIISTLGSTMLDDYKKAQTLDEQITAKEGTSFLDHPLDWISNQITLPDDYDQYNLTVRTYNRKADVIQNLENLTQDAVNTNNAIIQSVSQQSIAANSRVAASVYVDKANTALIDAQKDNIAKIDSLKQMNGEELNRSIEARRLIDEQTDQAMRVKQFNAEQGQRDLQRQELQLRIDDKTANDADNAAYVKTINAGRQLMNQPQFNSVADIKRYQMTSINGVKGDDQLKRSYDIGYQALQNNAATATGGEIKPITIDTSPAAAADFLVTSRGTLTAAQAPVQNLITKTYAEEVNREGAAGTNYQKNKPQFLANVDSKITVAAKRMQNDVMNGNDNIYAPPPMKSVLLAHPDLASNPIITKVFAPELATIPDQQKIDPDYVTAKLTQAIIKGDISYNDAVKGGAQLFQAAMETNNALKDYGRVGLPIQTKFNATVKTDPNAIYFTDNITKDLSSRVEYSKVINKALAVKVVGDQLNVQTQMQIGSPRRGIDY